MFSSQGNFNTYGHTTIANNMQGQVALGFGVDLRGGARAQSEISPSPTSCKEKPKVAAFPSENAESPLERRSTAIIQGNGGAGVSAGLGSRLYVFRCVEVADTAVRGSTFMPVARLLLRKTTFTTTEFGGSSSAGIRSMAIAKLCCGWRVAPKNGGPGDMACERQCDSNGAALNDHSGGVITCDAVRGVSLRPKLLDSRS